MSIPRSVESSGAKRPLPVHVDSSASSRAGAQFPPPRRSVAETRPWLPFRCSFARENRTNNIFSQQKYCLFVLIAEKLCKIGFIRLFPVFFYKSFVLYSTMSYLFAEKTYISHIVIYLPRINAQALTTAILCSAAPRLCGWSDDSTEHFESLTGTAPAPCMS
jgi:hypothetical protein